jgi:hypothetical protein
MTRDEITHDDGGIKYKAFPTDERTEDGGIVWEINYMQNPKDGYWGYRGQFVEKDGRFIYDGKSFDAPIYALYARIRG